MSIYFAEDIGQSESLLTITVLHKSTQKTIKAIKVHLTGRDVIENTYEHTIKVDHEYSNKVFISATLDEINHAINNDGVTRTLIGSQYSLETVLESSRHYLLYMVKTGTHDGSQTKLMSVEK